MADPGLSSKRDNGTMTLQRAQLDLEAAQGEVSRLEAELVQAKDRVAKLQAFLAMAREYGMEAPDAPAVTPSTLPTIRPRERMTSSAPQRHAAIMRAVLPELRRDAWTPADKLVPAVRAAGIMLDADVMRAAKKLCAFLAKEPAIEGSGGKGWRLRARR